MRPAEVRRGGLGERPGLSLFLRHEPLTLWSGDASLHSPPLPRETGLLRGPPFTGGFRPPLKQLGVDIRRFRVDVSQV